MKKRWVIAAADAAVAQRFALELNLPVALASVLVNRGYRDTETVQRFLNPQLRQLRDPFELPDMKAAVERILTGITRGERIVIYGDYDVDGVTSSALLTRVLRVGGADVANFLPHRMDEGYGLSADGIARCLKEHRPQLLIAVDCGTSSAAEIAGLKRDGVDVIVLDHHEPPAELPACLLVNPKRGGDGKYLASVGLAFKLAHALLKSNRDWKVDLREHLDLVAVGTIADMVPLVEENRILVKAGLERLPATGKVGLRALMDVAKVHGEVNPYHIWFRIGPRLNAAGRLSDAMAALELLLTEDAGRAAELAKQLEAHNAERQQIEAGVVEEALEEGRTFTEDRVLVLENPAWHVGVIGIAASKVLQQYYRPTVIIGEGGKGSCRSVTGFSMVAGLTECGQWLERFGGHEMAAGLTVKPGKVAELRRELNTVAARVMREEDRLPVVRVDAEVGLGDLDFEFIEALKKFEPCGQENPSPVFAVRGVKLKGAARLVGKNHWKFNVTDGETTVGVIWFGAGEEELTPGEMDVAFVPEWNEFRGEGAVQLRVRDVVSSKKNQ